MYSMDDFMCLLMNILGLIILVFKSLAILPIYFSDQQVLWFV